MRDARRDAVSGGLVVREARPEEYAEAGRVLQAAWAEFGRPGDPVWEDYFAELGDVAARAARTVVLVAVENGGVVGTATVELEGTIDPGVALAPGEAVFRMLGVDPGRRGRGIGRALVAACLERAKAAGKRTVTLHTAEVMVAALALYGSLGFERDPARDFEPAPGVALLGFRLVLPSSGGVAGG